MKHINKKLNSQNGASILLALMLFLVCFMVSAVILSSAATNADKMRERQSNQKQFLSVSSAASLLKEIFGGTTFTGWETNTVYECYGELSPISPDRHHDIAEICPKMEFAPGNEAKLREELAIMVYKVFTSYSQYVSPTNVDVSAKEFIISGDGMEDVKVTMSLDTDNYNLTCLLVLNDNAGEKKNALTLTFQGTVDAQSKETADKVLYSGADTVHQVLCLVEEADGTFRDKWLPRSYDITVYKITTKISYDGGAITKGVFS